jgi:hypothetical protein
MRWSERARRSPCSTTDAKSTDEERRPALPADSMSHRHLGDGKTIREFLQDDPVALFHHVQLHKHEPDPFNGAQPLRTSGLEGAYSVKHQADAPYTVKHHLDPRCQLTAGPRHRRARLKR